MAGAGVRNVHGKYNIPVPNTATALLVLEPVLACERNVLTLTL